MATNGTLLAILKQQLDILDTRDRPPAIINTDSHGLQTLSITFPNLIAKALDVAKHFRERVPQTNDRTEENKRVIVAVYFERSPEYIISILGCIIAGAVFMPLSPEWPQAFLISKIKEAKPSIIVRRASSLTREGQSIEECIPSDCQHIIFEDFIPYAQENPSNMEDLKNSLETAQHLYGNKDIAYLMFTSGSTGQPKQVLGTYEGLLNRVNWMSSKYPFQPGDKVCFKTPIIFVDSIWEIFGPLLAGVPLVVASQKLIRNGKEFVDFLSNQKITHLTAVPTHLQNLHVHFSGNQGLKLKQLVSSGESMTPELLKNLQRALHDTRILNLYGCTEAAGDSLCFDATKFHTESGLLRYLRL